jgi:hypothetical protein
VDTVISKIEATGKARSLGCAIQRKVSASASALL